MLTRSDLPGPLDPDELWLLQEELSELGELSETDSDEEETYRELALAIADGKPLRARDAWEDEDDYELDV